MPAAPADALGAAASASPRAAGLGAVDAQRAVVRETAAAGAAGRGATAPHASRALPATGMHETGGGARAPGVVIVQLVRYRPSQVAWGLALLARGAHSVKHDPAEGVRFARVLGSGRDGGFGLVPSLARQGLVVFVDDADAASRFVARSPTLRARRERADECLLAVLRVTRSRGRWDGVVLADDGPPSVAGAPVAAITRAAIRPRRALAFWRHAPPAERSLAQAAGCRFAVGLGEAPLLRQATVSLWDDAEALQAYANHGAHAHAAAGAWRHDWFGEWMFVRAEVLSIEGRWHGRRHG